MTHCVDHKLGGFCLCLCEECFSDFECICPTGCECHLDTPPLPAAYYAEHVNPPAEHTCTDCGTEVYRNGTRGRYPSRCPECKEKRQA